MVIDLALECMSPDSFRMIERIDREINVPAQLLGGQSMASQARNPLDSARIVVTMIDDAPVTPLVQQTPLRRRSQLRRMKRVIREDPSPI